MRGRRNIRESEFAELLSLALPSILGLSDLEVAPRLSGGLRPDFVGAHLDGHPMIIEAKAVTPTTQRRLREVANQLREYSAVYVDTHPRSEHPYLVLAVPDTLSDEYVKQLFASGIDIVVDGRMLRQSPYFADYLDILAEPEESQPDDMRHTAASLRERLYSLAPGRIDWPEYQQLVGEVLSFLFSPPLARPIGESANQSGTNRRDFVLPNYANDGFWEFLRTQYQAHYIVVDAKNYVRGVKKVEVLQLANYLADHGVGLFGLIACRKAAERSAEITRREQWIVYRKMILILNDADLRQMMSIKTADGDPADVIRQKIEDFRLAL